MLKSNFPAMSIKDNPAGALNWGGYGQKLDKPALGAIVSLTRKGGGHVGIVVGVNNDNSLVILGGNQSHSVSLMSVDRKKVKGRIVYPLNCTPIYELPLIDLTNDGATMH